MYVLTLERMLAGVPDLRLKWTDLVGIESLVLVSLSFEFPAKSPEAEMGNGGGVADLELLELFSQLFSSMIRAGDFISILGNEC